MSIKRFQPKIICNFNHKKHNQAYSHFNLESCDKIGGNLGQNQKILL